MNITGHARKCGMEMELDGNGKLVIYPSTSCESYRGATNPADVLSGLQACLKSMLVLDEKFLSR
jgi:hypothetical protein